MPQMNFATIDLLISNIVTFVATTDYLYVTSLSDDFLVPFCTIIQIL